MQNKMHNQEARITTEDTADDGSDRLRALARNMVEGFQSSDGEVDLVVDSQALDLAEGLADLIENDDLAGLMALVLDLAEDARMAANSGEA
jgi:hypothetical protein